MHSFMCSDRPFRESMKDVASIVIQSVIYYITHVDLCSLLYRLIQLKQQFLGYKRKDKIRKACTHRDHFHVDEKYHVELYVYYVITLCKQALQSISSYNKHIYIPGPCCPILVFCFIVTEPVLFPRPLKLMFIRTSSCSAFTWLGHQEINESTFSCHASKP